MNNAVSQIKFGTDGWRAVIADTYTLENVKILSQAVADFLGSGKKVAVGYDTRFMSVKFAQAAAIVLKSNGLEVILSDQPIPTPALSYAVKSRKLDLGIMITASHNPAEYNGFKIKNAAGGGASQELTREVEDLLTITAVQDSAPVESIEVVDLTVDYIKFIRNYIDLKKIKNKKFKVLVDSMYGSGDSFIASVLKGTSIRVEFMRNTINPSFGGGRPEPVEENLAELKRRVKNEKFDLGIALDGDADRIAAVAPGGVFIHPQKILGLLALHLNQDRLWSGGLVKTICGSTMMDNIAKFLGIKLYETPVGFKYISNLMETQDIVAGGEEAGGMGVKGYIPERDGTMAGLLLIEMMAYRNKNILKILNETEAKFGKYYYVRQDFHLDKRVEPKKENLPKELLGNKVIEIKDYDGIKLICEDESWLMFRGSGTEPIMRTYAEAKSLSQAKKLLALAKEIVLKDGV
ncbi:MAG: phosphoglucomutase/phosphomannomutase family protein [Candidatus Omnitrophica bacterium]|nr:phosphoglucomutase/phosphomannomutase family protein [Candidatus Omnitrophota bacterium]MBU4303239.1 phosphoglucomutase/phosphomannomutase family protein [Candidatus Omnitrophota bacterium]MBU4467211.1 phosphoglucomutase/phosphomannomutase family protein [Candidatus Omnitrophota bacterium]MCG2707297.1 phosphoglucomutase/phosphomannomutase family protein [Candidatus Omnitrophota bacterium]